MSLQEAVRALNQRVQQQDLWRQRVLSACQDNSLFFDSNDYLSLRQDIKLRQAYQQAFGRYPVGSGGSQLLSGYHPNHQALEQAFAEWLCVEACLVFSSGYAANLAVMSLLRQLNLHCHIDKKVHASIYDGLQLSKATYSRYTQLESLAQTLSRAKGLQAVITEGVFSMSGEQARLDLLAKLTETKHRTLLVDEAHALGVLGPEGKGATAAHHLSQQEVPLRILPLGKAFAGQGAIVAGQGEWIDALLQTGRSIIYSTAISPALCYGLQKTLEVVAAAEYKRGYLRQLIIYFKESLGPYAQLFLQSDTAIQYLPLGCPKIALNFQQALRAEGIYCSAIRAPTVPAKASGLRILLNVQHQATDIDRLVLHLSKRLD